MIRVHLTKPDGSDPNAMPAFHHDYPRSAATSVAGELEIRTDRNQLIATYAAFAWKRWTLEPEP